MNKIKFFLTFFTVFATFSQGECSERITLKDVRPLTEQLFEMHVTESFMSRELTRRSLSLMIERFDPRNEYLLAEEKSPYTQAQGDRLKKALLDYQCGEYTLYIEASNAIEKGIIRHRKIRKTVKKHVINNYQAFLDAPAKKMDNPLENENQIRDKIENSYIGLIQQKLKERKKDHFSKSVVASIIAFQEMNRVEFEENYLGAGGRSFLPTLLVKTFAKSMDAHSDYYSHEEAAQFRSSLNKELCGVGVVFKRDFDGVYIAGVIQGSPAGDSGKVREGDKLIAVDGHNIQNMYFKNVMRLMKGKKGESVTLTLQGKGKTAVKSAVMKRRPIVLHSERVSSHYVPFANGGIGVIDLPGFYSNGADISVAGDLKKEIKALKSRGNLLGIVIDMRENSGGFLDQAVKVCKCFMPRGLVAIAKYKNNKVRFMNHVGNKPLYEGPIIILTSKASASAAEIVSQTLQDYGLAIIVGDKRSFGKGSMQTQTITDEKAKHFFKVTVGRYYTASGRSPQVVGVRSDIVVNSHYFPYKMGEKHLMHALSADVLTQDAFDQLHQKVSMGSWRLNSSHATQVVPYLRPKMSQLRKRLITLKSNSEKRLKKNKNFQYFLKVGNKNSEESPPRFGLKDLQMKEAEAIIKDLVTIQQL
ncbi:hypothetical protein COB21_05920 [Candidatus Aerophobetes bacterium]|uniref:PDZ domain-containing protein n=1 Tax=Aerophobetes bacterium TaxID=2030807 RepID=A0A2A4WXP1_UNCAE|nr:MAG: hypothetical protein COB21_05920 [Candidatus Aerophobetes bacterium]